MFGVPVVLQSDNGSEFVNSLIEEMRDTFRYSSLCLSGFVRLYIGFVFSWNIINGHTRDTFTHVTSRPYHPQSQGLVEQGNHVVKVKILNYLTKLEKMLREHLALYLLQKKSSKLDGDCTFSSFRHQLLLHRGWNVEESTLRVMFVQEILGAWGGHYKAYFPGTLRANILEMKNHGVWGGTTREDALPHLADGVVTILGSLFKVDTVLYRGGERHLHIWNPDNETPTMSVSRIDEKRPARTGQVELSFVYSGTHYDSTEPLGGSEVPPKKKQKQKNKKNKSSTPKRKGRNKIPTPKRKGRNKSSTPKRKGRNKSSHSSTEGPDDETRTQEAVNTLVTISRGQDGNSNDDQTRHGPIRKKANQARKNATDLMVKKVARSNRKSNRRADSFGPGDVVTVFVEDKIRKHAPVSGCKRLPGVVVNDKPANKRSKFVSACRVWCHSGLLSRLVPVSQLKKTPSLDGVMISVSDVPWGRLSREKKVTKRDASTRTNFGRTMSRNGS
jgi:hypothetical protein